MSYHDCKYIGVLHINALGDQILAWPTMRALQQIFPGRIKLALGEGMRFMFYRDVQFKTQLRVYYQDPSTLALKVERLVHELGPCDTFIVLNDWMNDSISAVLNATRPKQSIGFQPSFDEYVDVERDVHMFDKIFALVQRISPHLDLQDFCAPPLFSPPAVKVAKRLKDQCIGKGTKLLFVHPETKPHKMWINSDYNYVLRKFLKERPQYQAVVCTQQRFELDCHPRIHSIRPHLELALALVGLADSFLGVDSCFLHAADLYGVPGIAMFGPTHPKIWGYRLTKPARNIYVDGQILNVNKEEVLQALLDVAP